jgi:hypothetical protein
MTDRPRRGDEWPRRSPATIVVVPADRCAVAIFTHVLPALR